MLTLNILFQTALQVPKTKPRLDDLLGALIGLGIQSCSQLRFIIAKGYKSVSRGKLRVDGAKSGENQVQTKRPFSVESQDALNSSATTLDNTCEVLSTRKAH